MPIYAYKGLAPSGKTVTGVRDADSPKTLRQLLRKDGVLVTELRAVQGRQGGQGAERARRAACRATSISAACSAASRRPRSRPSRASSRPCSRPASRSPSRSARWSSRSRTCGSRRRCPRSATAVNEGSSLADALAKHPKLFDDLFVSMVRAGEVAGNLDEVLIRLADFLESSPEAQVQGPERDDLPGRDGRASASASWRVLMIKVIPRSRRCSRSRARRCRWNTRLLIVTSGFLGRNSLWLLLGDGRRRSSLFVQWSSSQGRQAGLAPLRAAAAGARPARRARSTSAASRARSARCCRPACRCCARSRPPSRSSATCSSSRPSRTPRRRSPRASRSRRRSRSPASFPRR